MNTIDAKADRTEHPINTALKATANLVTLGEGMYALRVAALKLPIHDAAGIKVPAIEVSTPTPKGKVPVTVVMGTGTIASWLGADGGTVVVRVPPGGGSVLFTTYLSPSQPTDQLNILVERVSNSPQQFP